MTDEELMKRLREGATWDDDVAAADRIEALTAERDELQGVFDFQWRAHMRAVEMWRTANPGNDLVLPDSAKLTVWMLEQLQAARADAKEAEAYAGELEKEREARHANPADFRYWEGRYRDEKARVDELERDLKTCRMAQAVMDNTVAELERENTRLSGLMSERGQMLRRYDQMVVDGAKREEAWKAKLAKAVEALRLALKYNTAMHRGASEFNKRILTTLAEIEGEKG